MRDPLTLGAAEILAIAEDEPERLFPGTKVGMTQTFRKLARQWHPDRSRDAQADAVMARLSQLREAAEDRIARGTWTEPNTVFLNTTDGKTFRFRYLHKAAFELGTQYIGTENVLYCCAPEYSDLAERTEKTIKGFSFPSPKMQEEISRYLPELRASLKTTDGAALLIKRDPELVRLTDLLAFAGGKIDPKQVAWMLSSLLNLNCYLQYSGLTHNDISLDSYFVSPQLHFGALLGGWWYAAGVKAPLAALPTRSLDLAPREVLSGKKADGRLDQALIRAIGRELLGDPLGSKLPTMKEVPKALTDWLRLPGSSNAVEDYRLYVDQVLPGSFGPRRFVKWDVTPTSIYKRS